MAENRGTIESIELIYLIDWGFRTLFRKSIFLNEMFIEYKKW